MTYEELKPCPFCGGRCGRMMFSIGSNGTRYRIYCRDCGAEGPYVGEEAEAIAAWNRRDR